MRTGPSPRQTSVVGTISRTCWNDQRFQGARSHADFGGNGMDRPLDVMLLLGRPADWLIAQPECWKYRRVPLAGTSLPRKEYPSVSDAIPFFDGHNDFLLR